MASDDIELPPDFGARIRAAVAYAGVGLQEFADRINTSGASYSTLRNYIEQPLKQPGPLQRAALVEKLAEASGLSRDFFLGRDAALPTDDRLAAIQRQLDQIARDNEARGLELRQQIDERTAPLHTPRRRRHA